MPATYAAPTAFAETKGSNSGLPPEWMLMRGNLTRALIDMMNPLEGGYFDETPVEFAGLQTDTTRYGVVSGVGMEQAMASAGSEVSAITASTQTTTYNSLAIAEYVISYTETYRNQILMGGNANGVNLTLEELEAMVLENYGATLRDLVMASGAAISDNTVGSTTLYNSADDVFDFAAAFTNKVGAGKLGAPRLTLRQAQHNSIVESFRSESFLFGTDLLQRMNRVSTGHMLSDPYGIGVDVDLASDVVAASSVIKGFGVTPRCWKRGIASPDQARIPQGARRMVIPGTGLIIWERFSGSDTRTSGFNAYCNVGIVRKLASESFQCLFRSKE